jgi:cysteine synthase B
VSLPHTRVAHPGISGLIGHTPLVELRRVRPGRPGVRILAKLENRNPGGSVKDRPALRIIQQAIDDGRLAPGVTLLDATSGNTGIAYAMLGAAMGFAVKLFLPSNASAERRLILQSYGAEMVLTDPLEGSDGAIVAARRAATGSGDKLFYADQYSSEANWLAHYHGTGVEILEQTAGEVTHFVAGLGTTGTLMGVGRRLKESDAAITLVAVQPDSAFHGIEGLKYLESAMVPAIYDARLPDRHLGVGTEAAQNMVLRLAREEGLFVGPSGGAAVHAALQVASELEEGTVVTLLPDGGDRYLGDGFLEAM